jgi:hypothetical protein
MASAIARPAALPDLRAEEFIVNTSTSLSTPNLGSGLAADVARPTGPHSFVILHHQGHGDEHWDLMLEREGRLLTWQLPREPWGPRGSPVAARKIGDHRLAYLNYEGPISGGRGTVRRVDRGPLIWISQAADRFEFTIQGMRLAGSFRLEQGEGGWELRRCG